MPRHPGPWRNTATWRANADEYARYLLTIFRPETDYYDASTQKNPYEYTFDALVKWVESMQDDDNKLSHLRLVLMKRFVKNLRTRKRTKLMLNQYRGRKRDMWLHPLAGRKRSSWLLYDDDDIEELDTSPTVLSTRDMHARMQKAEMLNAVETALIKLRKSHSAEIGNDKPQEESTANGSFALYLEETKKEPVQLDDVLGYIEAKAHSIRTTEFTTADCLSKADYLRLKDLKETDEDMRKSIVNQFRPRKLELNKDQALLYNMCVNHLLGNPNKNIPELPKSLLVTGAAGTGKSQFIVNLSQFCEEHNIPIFKTTYNNINAIAINGRTLASTIDFSGKQDDKTFSSHVIQLNMSHLKKFKELSGIMETNSCCRLVIIDEISNLAPWHLANLDAACRLATKKDEPYGGIPIIMIGDLTQMGPVKAGMSLTHAVFRLACLEHPELVALYNKNPKMPGESGKIPPVSSRDEHFQEGHPVKAGAELFRQAKWFKLQQQVRAIQDPVHTDFVHRLGDGNPVLPTDIENFKELSVSDFNDESEEAWLRAPFVVATNHERNIIMHQRACMFGRHHRKVIIRWPLHMKGKNDLSQLPPNVTEESSYYEYFVSGADGNLTANVNRSLHLVNALPVRYHSLVLANDIQEKMVREAVEQSRRKNNNKEVLVTLDEPPKAINVVVEREHLHKMHPGLVQKHKTMSLSEEEVVIPLAPQADKEWIKVFSIKDPLDTRFDMEVKPHFPCDMNFAITVNKAQGQTLDNVVIALSERVKFNFSHEAIDVAFSRVRTSSCVRLFLIGDSPEDKKKRLQYLYKLRGDPCTKAFFEGYDTFDHKNWLAASYSSERSVRRYMIAPLK